MEPLNTDLTTQRLRLRRVTWTEDDRAFNHHLLSHARIRQFYATRLTRSEADDKLRRLIDNYDNGQPNWLFCCDRFSGKRLGFTGLAPVDYETPFTPAVEIGWIYTPQAWGHGYASEAGSELLRHGFSDLELDEIVSFAVHNNHASLTVMERIGMHRDMQGDFHHPLVTAPHAHLKPHVLYRQTRRGWLDAKSAALAQGPSLG